MDFKIFPQIYLEKGKQKHWPAISIHTLGLVVSWSTFGSNCSLLPSWLLCHRFCSPEFIDIVILRHLVKDRTPAVLQGHSSLRCNILLKVNLWPSLRSVVLWTCLEFWSLLLQLWPVSLSQPQNASTTMLHCRAVTGQVMSGAWLPPDMTLRINSDNQTITHKFQVGVCVSLTKHGLLSGNATIQPNWWKGYMYNHSRLSSFVEPV